VAGATRWLNPGHVIFTRVLTDGTPTVWTTRTRHTVTVDQPLLKFEKTVTDVTSGQNPATQRDARRHAALPDPHREPGHRSAAELLAARRARPPQHWQPSMCRARCNVDTLPAGADASNTNPSAA
jgi:hypothetical protein